jgi:MFS family permease
VASGLFAMFFFASLYVQDVLGYSPLKAGLAFLPVTAGIAIGAGIAQQLIRRMGVRWVTLLGLTMATIGMVLLTQLPVDGSYATDLLPGLSILSVGMGLVFVPITLLATSGVQAEDQGLASGLFNTAQQVGGSLGLAVLSSLAATRTADVIGEVGKAQAQVDGFHVAFWGASILLAAGVVVFVAMLRRRHVAGVDVDAAPAPA